MEALKLYLASGSQNRAQVCFIANTLSTYYGFNVISTWHSETVELKLDSDKARRDVEQLGASDLCLALYPYGATGCLQEIAYAVAKGIPVIYVRPMGYKDDDPLLAHLFDGLYVLRYNGLELVSDCELQLSRLHKPVLVEYLYSRYTRPETYNCITDSIDCAIELASFYHNIKHGV